MRIYFTLYVFKISRIGQTGVGTELSFINTLQDLCFHDLGTQLPILIKELRKFELAR